MRTNIVLNEELVREAMALAHVRTKREAVEIALRELVSRRKQVQFLTLPGKDLLNPVYDIRAVRAGMEEKDRAHGAG
ncbi:MAG: type II toxin-antitoxin system VapB family antitoxin [Leptospirales bacterium]